MRTKATRQHAGHSCRPRAPQAPRTSACTLETPAPASGVGWGGVGWRGCFTTKSVLATFRSSCPHPIQQALLRGSELGVPPPAATWQQARCWAQLRCSSRMEATGCGGKGIPHPPHPHTTHTPISEGEVKCPPYSAPTPAFQPQHPHPHTTPHLVPTLPGAPLGGSPVVTGGALQAAGAGRGGAGWGEAAAERASQAGGLSNGEPADPSLRSSCARRQLQPEPPRPGPPPALSAPTCASSQVQPAESRARAYECQARLMKSSYPSWVRPGRRDRWRGVKIGAGRRGGGGGVTRPAAAACCRTRERAGPPAGALRSSTTQAGRLAGRGAGRQAEARTFVVAPVGVGGALGVLPGAAGVGAGGHPGVPGGTGRVVPGLQGGSGGRDGVGGGGEAGVSRRYRSVALVGRGMHPRPARFLPRPCAVRRARPPPPCSTTTTARQLTALLCGHGRAARCLGMGQWCMRGSV